MSGSAPWETRSASAAQTGTCRGWPPGGAHSMSVVDGPCAGLKKHGGRRTGRGSPATRALHGGDGVAAVLERLGDVPDLVGRGDPSKRLLGGFVGVEGALVVLTGGLVELGGQQLAVETLELLAEAGDVLVGHLAHRVEVGGAALLEGALTVATRHRLRDEDDRADDDQQHHGAPYGEATRGVRIPLRRRESNYTDVVLRIRFSPHPSRAYSAVTAGFSCTFVTASSWEGHR